MKVAGYLGFFLLGWYALSVILGAMDIWGFGGFLMATFFFFPYVIYEWVNRLVFGDFMSAIFSLFWVTTAISLIYWSSKEGR